jgi:hypothetical protein
MSRELNKNEKDLLEISAKELTQMLTDNEDLSHVKQMAYGYYSKETEEEFQVQVIVTRRTNDFLEAFQTEEMSEFKGR